jgi:glycerophosphoryl diester phosphodiesterase
MSHPYLHGLEPTLHIAHRGGALLAPENTMAAFRPAVTEYGTDMLELDVHATSDGVIVVHHDETLERCTDGIGRLADHDWDTISRLDAGHTWTGDGGETFPFRGRDVRIPTLEAVFEAFPGLRINIELKAAGFEQAFADLIRRLDVVDRVCVGAEEDAIAARLRAVMPEACHYFPRDALTAFVMAQKTGAPAPEFAPEMTVLDMPATWQGMQLVDPPFLEFAAEHGLWVNVWTIDEAAEMRSLVEMGVGGIMTDRPDTLRAVLNAAGADAV